MYRRPKLTLGVDTPPAGSSISLDTFEGDLSDRRGEGELTKNYHEVTYSPLSPLMQGSPFPFNESESYSSGFNSYKNNKSRRPGAADGEKRPSRMPTGWKLGTAIAACLTSVILIGNISLLIAFTVQIRRDGYTTSVAPVRTGNCAELKKLGVGVHLIINVISTLLLGASNYCMQTISAPTRRDVDKAHAAGRHLDIGIPSVRNLRFIQKRRLLFWLGLGLTSIPLHLVYNSIFFVSTINNLYPIYYAGETFATGGWFNTSVGNGGSSSTVTTGMSSPALIQDQLMHTDRFEKLSNDDCITAYSKTLLEDRGALVLVFEEPKNCTAFQVAISAWSLSSYGSCTNASATSLYYKATYSTDFVATHPNTNWYSWICSQEDYYHANEPPYLCSNGAWKDQLSPNEWEIAGVKVKHCYSEKLAPVCQLQVATNLIGVVIAFNIVKVIIISIMATSNLINQQPLVTVGDAAASFIERPEPFTRGMCLLPAKEIINSHETDVIPPKEYQPRRNRWSAAVSGRRWVVASILTFIALAVTLGLMGYAIFNIKELFNKGDFKSLWDLGVGTLTPYTVIASWDVPAEGEAAVVATVLITNMPQLLLSFLYLILNGLVTAMSAAAEWSNYAYNAHRPLRVSFPKGGQRSTFFLQLPYRYSVPMMALSILMHWLISQSIFIAQIYQRQTSRYSREDLAKGVLTGSSVITTGAFSPMAIFFTALVIAFVFGAAVVMGRFRLREGLPLGASCSAAIAASCHTLDGTSSCLPVKWGVVVPPEEGKDGVGHCSFSNDHVEHPEPGKRYA